MNRPTLWATKLFNLTSGLGDTKVMQWEGKARAMRPVRLEWKANFFLDMDAPGSEYYYQLGLFDGDYRTGLISGQVCAPTTLSWYEVGHTTPTANNLTITQIPATGVIEYPEWAISVNGAFSIYSAWFGATTCQATYKLFYEEVRISPKELADIQATYKAWIP